MGSDDHNPVRYHAPGPVHDLLQVPFTLDVPHLVVHSHLIRSHADVEQVVTIRSDGAAVLLMLVAAFDATIDCLGLRPRHLGVLGGHQIQILAADPLVVVSLHPLSRVEVEVARAVDP